MDPVTINSEIYFQKLNESIINIKRVASQFKRKYNNRIDIEESLKTLNVSFFF
jgi:hypothetical protein